MKFGLRSKWGVAIKSRRIAQKVPKKIYPVYSFFYRALINFIKARGLICTNSLAYTFLLAFIPFLVAIASISDWLPFSNRLINDVQNYFFSKFLPRSGTQIYDLFKLSFKHSTRLSIAGGVSLIATSYMMMFAVEQHIHQMWHINRQRKIIYSLGIFTGFFIGGPMLVYSLADIGEVLDFKFNSPIFTYLLPHFMSVLVTILSLIAVYKFIPNKKVKWKHAIVAGMIAGIVFSLLRWGFSVYMARLEAEYKLLYGSIAILPIFLLWLYISSLNFLYCAQIIYILERKNKRK